jgi:transposase-like protein
MITETKKCPKCGSERLYRNGKTAAGKQKFLCKDCKAAGTLDAELRYTEQEKAQILAAYQERPSMRGIGRIFGVTRQTLTRWMKKSR